MAQRVLSPDMIKMVSSFQENGKLLAQNKLFVEAIAEFKKALEIMPESVSILTELHQVYQNTNDEEKQLDVLQQIYRIQKDEMSIYQRAMLMDLQKRFLVWDHLQEHWAYFKRSDILDKGVLAPFHSLSCPLSVSQLQQVARAFVKKNQDFQPRVAQFSFKDRKFSDRKIRLGFLGADFRIHPTGFVIAEFFDLIDKSKFELYLYDNFPAHEQAWPRKRIYATTSHVCDVQNMSNEQLAEKIYKDEIDVLIDINGLTLKHRLAVMPYQSAPVQATFLGFCGTQGGIPGLEYNFSDKYCIHENEQCFYDEKIKYLEPVHRLIDRKIEVPKDDFKRSHLGLKEDQLVLCCFNNTYKYTPAYFDLWARILKRVPKAVLWFYKPNEFCEANILKEMAKRDIPANRVVFTPMMTHPAHMARYRVADLFLDTELYGAHTTAMEALYMGCPMLTCPGTTFVSRVGGSLLTALQMPELICKDVAEYEEKAVSYLTNPESLKALKKKVADKVKSSSLFDTEKFTRSFEKACLEMLDDFQQKK